MNTRYEEMYIFHENWLEFSRTDEVTMEQKGKIPHPSSRKILLSVPVISISWFPKYVNPGSMSRTKLFQLVISGKFSAPVFYDRVINFLDSMREIYCLAIYVYPLCTYSYAYNYKNIQMHAHKIRLSRETRSLL